MCPQSIRPFSETSTSIGFWWWLPEDAEDPETERSRGGTFRRGRLTVVECDSGSAHHFDAFGEVEKGWIPPHEEWERFELLGKPQFTSRDEILLTPEFGKPCRFVIPGLGGR